MSPRGIGAGLAAAVVAAGLALLVPAAPAAAGCVRERPGKVVRETPWAQHLLSPGRAWPFSRGAGVTVAVVDAGVDRGHPQLGGALATGTGGKACVGRGTALASLIAGRGVPGIGFRGFAPDATVMPVRIADEQLNDNQWERPSVPPQALAQGIRWAVRQGASVVTVAIALYAKSAALRSAVAYAQEHDVLVVAAVGDNHQDPSLSDKPDPVPYPASYPGVVGVGAITATGDRWRQSQVGGYVDIVAPGEAVLAAALGGGYQAYTGTGFAAAFVAGTAALVRSADPDLSADQVRRRLLATASPSPGGGHSRAYGAGLVDPYRAVVELVGADPPVAAAPLRSPAVDPAVAARTRGRALVAGRAAWIAAGAAALGIAVAVLVVCWPRGRRRRWLPGYAPPRPDAIPAEPAVPLTTKDVFATERAAN
jgi:type VII secretion-associated serine protease mycosin